MIPLTIRYSEHPPLTVRVPDMGLTPREWADAAFMATNFPCTNRYGVPGALEVAAGLEAEGALDGTLPPLDAGDCVEVAGKRVRCVAVDGSHADVWGVPSPSFAEPEAVALPPGPPMHVALDVPPPDAVAYCEDSRDRLWTGRGGGEWRCLTDPAGRTAARTWAGVWREHGPLTPLVPVTRLDAPGRVPWQYAGSR